ncbi:MAG: hypothetical protein NTW25_02270 [Candidatus Kapabacteria bacterium]|nr:hypothetical protein [Candidatus Kapabacteria bacterium]
MKKLHASTSLVKATLGDVYTTDWFSKNEDTYLKHGSFKNFSIQLAWSSVVGTANGTIDIIGTIDGLETILSTVSINSTSNLTDVSFVNFDRIVNAVKLKITFNSITSFTFESDLEIYF